MIFARSLCDISWTSRCVLPTLVRAPPASPGRTVERILRKALCGPEKLYEALLQGGLVFHMFGALAEFERSLIQERPQTVSLSIA
jgi:hypothetical protein